MIKYLLLLMLVLPFSVHAETMSVDEAYNAIPHRKTDFIAQDSKIDAASIKYLEQMFELVNRAIVQRVQTFQWFSSRGGQGNSYEEYSKNIAMIQKTLDELNAPASLANVKSLVAQSIKDQSDYFKSWDTRVRAGEAYQFNRGDPLILSSHNGLVNAYYQLMQTFPRENGVNKQAFFDHLCALDFI